MSNELHIGHRKIQKIRNAQYVNLPKIWTMNNHTKQGDIVQIRLESDGSLNIRVLSATSNSNGGLQV